MCKSTLTKKSKTSVYHMTYWLYHILFTLPLIIFFAWILRKKITRGHVFAWAVVCLIVFIFTTPWDNYAVFLGVWGFGKEVSLGYPFSHLADDFSIVGHIPFEEYAYFIIEATLACQFTAWMLTLKKPKGSDAN